MLVQMQKDSRLQLPSLYFAEVLRRQFNSRVEVFRPEANTNSRSFSALVRFWNKVAFFFSLGELGLYSSVGAKTLVQPGHLTWQTRHEDLFTKLLSGLETKRDVVELEIDGITVGDLLYDSLLKKGRYTVELGSDYLVAGLRELVQIWFWWRDYFASHTVVAVVGTTPYLQGIPMRIAASAGLIAIEASLGANHTRRLNSGQIFSRMENLGFKMDFEKLGPDERSRALAEARELLGARLSQGVGSPENQFAVQWTSKSESHKRALSGQRRPRAVIYCHEFTDSPNIYRNLFPDYWEWLVSIGENADTSKIEWMIKLHPAASAVSQEAIQRFLNIYKGFRMLPSTVNNRTVLDQGVDAVFTMYGSVGLEFAYFGVPVVNASLGNPHISFGFNLNPSSVSDFERFVRSPLGLRPQFMEGEVLACFFMHNLKNGFSYFYPYRLRNVELETRFWSHFLRFWRRQDHKNILFQIGKFIDSGKYQLDWDTFGVDTCMNDPNVA